MKYLLAFSFCLFSFQAFACVDLSGAFEKPNQEMKDYLDLKVFKQTACQRVDIYDASIFLPTGLYMENPNPVSYRLDGQEYCNSSGFCYTASIDDSNMHLKHTPKEFSKDNGTPCTSGTVSFSIDQKKSLQVTRECSDGSIIAVTYQIH